MTVATSGSAGHDGLYFIQVSRFRHTHLPYPPRGGMARDSRSGYRDTAGIQPTISPFVATEDIG